MRIRLAPCTVVTETPLLPTEKNETKRRRGHTHKNALLLPESKQQPNKQTLESRKTSHPDFLLYQRQSVFTRCVASHFIQLKTQRHHTILQSPPGRIEIWSKCPTFPGIILNLQLFATQTRWQNAVGRPVVIFVEIESR